MQPVVHGRGGSVLFTDVGLRPRLCHAAGAQPLLVVGQKQFYRRARLFSTRFNFKWLLSTVAALASFAWLLFFSFKATPYQNELWWKFALDDQAPRGLRTAFVAASTFLIFYVLNVLRPPRQPVEVLDQETLEVAEDIIQQQDNADGNFALTGDKSLLFSESRKSFIMFAVHNRSWVSLGDPIGSSDAELIDLIWEFKSMAAREQGHAVFYQIGREHIDWYIDAGFHLFKLGEEARINLQQFSLQETTSKRRKKLRNTQSRAARDGLSFRIVHPPHSDELLEELSHISTQWLSLKNVREKSFSLGRFGADYINRFPLALIYDNGRISAFANILTTRTKAEATIDLMRHLPDANKTTMDFLFIELMLALRAENYSEFNLGMAPMSGLVEHRNARLWDRFGLLIYKKGSHFYNFAGLRNFKNKFDPEWVPRYLATTKTGVSPFLTLVDIAALTSGGVKGVFRKT
ncbi:MAG: bifunctional lysylphosphatidylglycerol flippase/synthetase MprF [Deltaproteobacteria bacterium]|nr:bifunctional lysylphosphatidylglycerol flippase/synthetase MprF [Deltaproteobacteria bacterium]